MTLPVTNPTEHSAYRFGAAALFLAAAGIAIALGFEHLAGFVPCPLCLQQRYAYYAGVPILFGALVLLSAGQPRWSSMLFLLVALAFFANAGLGVYHSGAEWGFWPGPQTCGGGQALTTSAGNLLQDLQQTNVVRCDEAAGRFIGLSFAGWNVIASLLVMLLGLRAAYEAWYAH
jgi:disulfide bond formation protein DsbB